MVFDCVPSDIKQVYWKFTLNDLRVKMRLYLGEKQAGIVQNYQSLSLVVSQAMGGKSKSSASRANPSNEEALVPQTKNELLASFKGVFG